MKNLITATFFISFTLIFSGCASIVSRSNWPLTINSKPSGAKIEITNRSGHVIVNNQTPVTLKLKASSDFFTKESYKVKLTLEGYPEKIIPVECRLNGWYVGNVVFGGLIGFLIVDPATGAMYKLDTNIIDEVFEKKTASEGPSLKVMDMNDIPDNLKNHLVSLK